VDPSGLSKQIPQVGVRGQYRPISGGAIVLFPEGTIQPTQNNLADVSPDLVIRQPDLFVRNGNGGFAYTMPFVGMEGITTDTRPGEAGHESQTLPYPVPKMSHFSPDPTLSLLDFTVEEADRANTVWGNTHYMSTSKRLYVTGGVIAGDFTGLTNLSDAAETHDAVDGHFQTTLERFRKAGTGGVQLAATGLPVLRLVRRLNGNSLSYVGQTHVYRIIGPDGSTYKIGESMRGIKDGLSIRGEVQARRLTRKTGELYRSQIRDTFASKSEARAHEKALIDRFRAMYGTDKLQGNKTNR
jgi:hypothetical protein